eukprot:CAMPEP_0119049142 /NCGR_PEP_ID=MMETSP1177-20130426/63076_1 /TAXON_ID=2985 /ORGANISM="Ochromonas sp, Strain CCMP1899" /LENGTH=46 /DNA_ID= /DNA_START= /DNA_END= /DNA_ORIENTATION=
MPISPLTWNAISGDMKAPDLASHTLTLTPAGNAIIMVKQNDVSKST